jgi:hypothetical protein
MFKKYSPYLIVFFLAAVAYANVFGNDFLYDDEFLIIKNENIRHWSGIYKSFLMSSTGGAGAIDSFYRPLQGVLYTIIYQIFGLSVFGFHLLNVLLHLANAALLLVLASRLGFSRKGAVIAAVLWAIHPIHTEAITYQSATADPLYTFFVLGGLCVLVPSFSWTSVFTACGFFLLGLLSKETAIVFPALAVVCRFFLLDIKEDRWDWKKYVFSFPMWVLALFYLLARKTILNFDNTFHFYKTANLYTENFVYRVYTALATIPSYGELMVWPHDLHMDRAFPVFVNLFLAPVLVGAVFMLVAIGTVVRERNQSRPLGSFAVLWFFGSHIPHMGILLPVNSFFLEHWMYLPSIGLFLASGQWLALRNWSLRWLAPGVAMMVVVLITLTMAQNKIWSTPIQFYSRILKFEPKVARVHNNIAMAYTELHQDQTAIAHFKRAIDISDDYPQTRHNLALALVRENKFDDAIINLKRALEIDPDFYHSAAVLSRIYQSIGDEEHSKIYADRHTASFKKFQH